VGAGPNPPSNCRWIVGTRTRSPMCVCLVGHRCQSQWMGDKGMAGRRNLPKQDSKLSLFKIHRFEAGSSKRVTQTSLLLKTGQEGFWCFWQVGPRLYVPLLPLHLNATSSPLSLSHAASSSSSVQAAVVGDGTTIRHVVHQSPRR
jgi:hypothetical protein